jgi:hypothetical protein
MNFAVCLIQNPLRKEFIMTEKVNKQDTGKVLGVTYMLARKYESSPLSPEWIAALGEISRPFRWLVYGHPKNGKTTFLLQFCKDATQWAKVFYNSMEEGDSKTMQQAMQRVGMADCKPGKFLLGDRIHYPMLIARLSRPNSGDIVVIDSRDYINMTTDQYKKMVARFPKKSFIIVCWEQSGKPLGKYAKDIEYMVDMVTRVHDHVAVTNGRFGAGLIHDIWPEKKRLYNPKSLQGGLF